MVRVLLFFLIAAPLAAQSIPREAVVKYNEAQAKFSSGDTAGAESLLGEAARLAPEGCEPCDKLLFNIHFRQKKWAEAVADLDRLAPNGDANMLGSQYLRVGFALVESDRLSPGDARLAEDALKKAVAANDSLTIVHFHLARLYHKQGREEDTVAQFETFLAKNPGDQLSTSILQRVGIWNYERTGQLSAVPVERLDTPGRLDFSEYRGKVVLVDLWATWCKPCRKSQIALRRLKSRYKNKPFEIVSIAGDNEKQKVIDYLAREEMDWPQFYDTNLGLVENFMRISSYPTFWVVDGEGRIAYHRKGWNANVERRLQQEIGKAMLTLNNPKSKDK
ncbi:MAG: redoxin family protein [Acidobacteriota bacterium]|nr:redoxin family protein [Acidobacteriota bacterium]